MFPTSYAEGYEASVTLLIKWSTKYNYRSSIKQLHLVQIMRNVEELFAHT